MLGACSRAITNSSLTFRIGQSKPIILVVNGKGTKEPILLFSSVDFNQVAANLEAVVMSIEPVHHCPGVVIAGVAKVPPCIWAACSGDRQKGRGKKSSKHDYISCRSESSNKS